MKKKTDIFRAAALTAVLAVTLAALPSCSDGSEVNPPVITHPETTENNNPQDNYSDKIIRSITAEQAAKALDKLPDSDFGGAATIIATVSHADLLCPSEAADEVSAAALARNKYIEEKYSTSIISKLAESEDALRKELSASKNSGIYYTDLLGINLSEVGSFALDGLLMNMYSIPDLDLGADYFSSDSVAQLTAGYKLYAISGAATEDVREYYAVFFNKNLAQELGMGSLYELVYSDGWTWEKFSELTHIAAAARGTDNATAFGAMSDLPEDRIADAFFESSGNHYVDTTFGQSPAAAAIGDSLADLISLARTTLGKGSGFVSGYGADTSALSSFRAGNVLFYIGTLRDAEPLASIEVQWGVLPLPSHAGAPSVTATDPTRTAVLATPSYNSLADNASIMLTALCASSVGLIDDAAVEYVTNVSLRDNSSIGMVRRMAAMTPCVDFTQAFGSLESVVSATRGAFYASVGGASFTTQSNRYLRNANNLLRRTFPLTNAEQ